MENAEIRCDILLKTKLCPHTFFTRKNKDRRSLLGEQDAAAFAI